MQRSVATDDFKGWGKYPWDKFLKHGCARVDGVRVQCATGLEWNVTTWTYISMCSCFIHTRPVFNTYLHREYTTSFSCWTPAIAITKTRTRSQKIFNHFSRYSEHARVDFRKNLFVTTLFLGDTICKDGSLSHVLKHAVRFRKVSRQ